MNIILSLKAKRNRAEESGLRKHLIAFLAISLLILSGYAQAQSQIKLALCLDDTQSINTGEWILQKKGTASGVHEALYPGYLNGEVEITIIRFAETADTAIGPVVIDSQATLETLTGTEANDWEDGSIFAVENHPTELYTNIKACIDEASTQIGGTADDGIQRIIDVSTDGATNRPFGNCGTSIYDSFSDTDECALIAADNAYDNGIDVLNVLAVGAEEEDLTFLRVLTIPTPADASTEGGLFTPPTTNPALGDKGFVVSIADYNQYEPAITAKIRAELTTIFTVTKAWSGGADPGEVEVQLTCTGAMVDGNANTNSKSTTANTASFTVTGFTPGDTTCSATETPFSGWTETGNTCSDIDVSTTTSCTITNTLDEPVLPPPPDTAPPEEIDNPEVVPTLPEWALIMLSLLLVMLVYSGARRKQT